MTDDKTLLDFDPDAQPQSERTITIAHVDEPHDHYGGRHSHGACMAQTQPPNKGWLGNPFRLADFGREDCIEMFEKAFVKELRDSRRFANACVALPGQVVACHCRETGEDEPACHLDVVREKLLDGTVFGIAHHVHGIPLVEWKRKVAADESEVTA